MSVDSLLDEDAAVETNLPRPVLERWQPLRSGLVNLYRYDAEEFCYEDGHLLLRGNNGTGKSRVLALQLPFLLDGELTPLRMEPDRDPAKRVEWNLLMGKHEARRGYTWIEFGRRDDDGGEHYLTLGCGLEAVAGRGLKDRWFFVTEQRVGRDLFLLSPSRIALAKGPLGEALGETGRLFTTAAQYREAVDQGLFGLGSERFAGLVNLLIQLRQPQLSRKLDERRLSEALSESLPPLSGNLLDDVAEAFRGLEEERLSVARLKAAGDAVGKFLDTYSLYTQLAAARRSERVRTTHAAYEGTQRRQRALEGELADQEQRLVELRELLASLELAGAEAAEVVRTLESSPQMRDKKALDDARRLAEERRRDAERAANDVAEATAAVARAASREEAARRDGEAAWRRAEEALEKAGRQAGDAGLGRDHQRTISELDLPAGEEPRAWNDALERLRQAAENRRRGARLVAELSHALASAAAALTHAKERHAEESVELDDALEQQRRSVDAFDAAVAALVDAYRTWHEALKELEPLDPADLHEELDEWARLDSGPSPVDEAVRTAEAAATRRLARLRAELEEAVADAERALAELEAEAEELHRGVHRPPPAPHTRDLENRAERDGAPLWLLCDFAEPVDDATRAGVEAALEAAGLLDAWVTPAGQVLAADEHDTVLLPVGETAPSGRSLSQILRPDASRTGRAAAVDDATLIAVLDHIGFGEGQGWAWVDADGRFALGPLTGAWSKPAAQHLGGSAREAERQRRLAALEEAIAAAQKELADRRAELADHGEREQRCRREVEDAPGSDSVLRARLDVAAAAVEVDRRRGRVAAAEEKVIAARRRRDEAQDERDATARDLGLADWVDRLQALEDVLALYLGSLAGLEPTLRAHFAARQQTSLAAEHHGEARQEEERRRDRRREAEERARRAEIERDTLQEAVGADVDEILERLEAARAEVERVGKLSNEKDQEERRLDRERVRTVAHLESEQQNLQRETAERQAAIDGLARFVRTRLLTVALPALDAGDPDDWSTTRAVELARAIDAQLPKSTREDDADNNAWERHQGQVVRHFQILTDHLLPHDFQPFSTLEDDLFVVTVPFDRREFSMAELAEHLGAELAFKQRVLSERELEVIDNHLIGEVATHLHERLHLAEEMVREINAELEERPTSTGMALRFTWKPTDDGPTGFDLARRRLLATGGTWSPEERKRLGEFLQALIDEERSQGEGTWRDQLAAALDYRRWHSFGVERRQDGQWKRLTRKTHGTGSGGEKAIALTLPQFAAATAYYRSVPHAPRLILLDEAFVGVDADMRAKCMGLMAAFDLDFMMTSEREWGCYATLPGVAIYQLATRPGIDAVGLTRWVWNGRERRLEPREASPIIAPATEKPLES